MKQPIFLDGSEDLVRLLASTFRSFMCCFNYGTDTFDPNTVGDFPYITGIIMSPTRISFILHATNPITADYYERSITIQQAVYDDGVVKARVIFPDTTASYGSARVTLSPCVVLFLQNNLTRQNTSISVSVDAPLSCTLDSVQNKLLLSLDTNNTDFSTLAPPTTEDVGITSINGLTPVNGNISIVGVGDTSVTVEAVQVIGDSSGDSTNG